MTGAAGSAPQAGAAGPTMCMPTAETCANEGADNDCNGTKDDIAQRSAACTVAANQGNCKNGQLLCMGSSPELQCVANAPTTEVCNNQDDDCDGMVDDGFDFQNDKQHCGSCDKACGSGELCCSGQCKATGAGSCDAAPPTPPACGNCAAGEECCDGKCVSTKTSVDHCGSCTNKCTAASPGCCDGNCVNFKADVTCGSCSKSCGLLTLGGIACHCGELDGKTDCVGLTVANLLQLCL
jgi:hypothetical protein